MSRGEGDMDAKICSQCKHPHWYCGPLSGVQAPEGYEAHVCQVCGFVKLVSIEDPVTRRARGSALKRWGSRL